MFFCGRSDYFRALLEYKLSESPQNEMFKESITEVYLNDVSPDVFAAVVAFIYQDTALVSGRVVSQSTYTGMFRPKSAWFQSRISIFWNISYAGTNPRKCPSRRCSNLMTYATQTHAPKPTLWQCMGDPDVAKWGCSEGRALIRRRRAALENNNRDFKIQRRDGNENVA